MEISELITTIREDFLDDTFSGWESATDDEKAGQFIWSDSALLRYLTRAQQQACNRTDFIYDDSTASIVEITLIDGQRSYSISQKITVIEDITYDDNLVTHISKNDRDKYFPNWRTDENNMSGNVNVHYLIRSRKIFFYPAPGPLDVGQKVYLSTYRTPLDNIESDSDDLEIPEEFHYDLIWWVLYEAYSKQDGDRYDKERGLGYLAQFNEKFGEYIPSEVRLNQMQEPKSLNIYGADYVGNSNQCIKECW